MQKILKKVELVFYMLFLNYFVVTKKVRDW